MKKLFFRLNMNPILKSIFGFSISSILIAVINFISIPIITRFFSPDSVGRVNVFSSYVVFATEIVMLGIGHSFLRFYHEYTDKKSQKQFFVFCVLFLLCLTMTATIAILFCWQWISVWLFGEINFPLIVCFVFSIIFNTFINLLIYLDRAEDHPFLFSIQSIFLVLVNKLLYVTVGIYSANYQLTIVFIVFGQLATLLFGIYMHKNIFLQKITFKQFNNFSKNTIKYAIPIWMSMIVAQISTILPLTIVKLFFNYELVGIFTTTISMAAILTLLQGGFATYWNTFVFSNYRKNSTLIQELARNAVVTLSGVALLMILGQDILFFLVGKAFIDGKTIFVILVLGNLCNAINDIGSYGIYLSGKTVYNFYVAIASVLFIAFFCIIFIPLWGITGMAAGVACASFVSMIIRNAIGTKFYKIYTKYYQVLLNIFFVFISALLSVMLYNKLVLRYLLCIIVLIVFIISNWRCIADLFINLLTSIVPKGNKAVDIKRNDDS